jgi:hypothetical protein
MNVCAAHKDKIDDVGNTVVDFPSSDESQTKCVRTKLNEPVEMVRSV